VLDFSAGGENQDPRRTLRCAQLRQNREPVEAGKIEVEHDQIRRIVERGPKAGYAVMYLGETVAVPGQGPVDVTGELPFVFDD
jgi:hypothetical protein